MSFALLSDNKISLKSSFQILFCLVLVLNFSKILLSHTGGQGCYLKLSSLHSIVIWKVFTPLLSKQIWPRR